MEWSWIILFLMSVTAGKGLFRSKPEEGTGAEVTMTSSLPFSLQISTPRSNCSSLGLSWGGLGPQWGYFPQLHLHWLLCKMGKVEAWTGPGVVWVDWSENGDTDYAQKFQGQATLTADTSSNVACTELSNPTSEDSVVYSYMRHGVGTTSWVCQKPGRSRKRPWDWDDRVD